MIRFIILLYILSISTAFAGENIHFLDKPDNLTSTEAMIAIGHAAKNRKYNVPDVIGDTLRVTLNHKGYNIVLDFSVSGNEIVYADSTTYVDTDYDDEDSSESKTITKPVPASWLKSLRSNADNFFLLIKNIKDNQAK